MLRLSGSSFNYREGDLIINWGSTINFDGTIPILNHPNLIRRASNKLIFFGTMRDAGHGDIIPPFWTRAEDIPDDAFPVLCRTVLAGHSGAGIVISANRDSLVQASLYVKYIPKKEEYRVHCGRREEINVIAIQRKARSQSATDVNWRVRSHSNGFVFVRNNVDPPPCVIEAAVKSFETSALDFGAVDVIFNEKRGAAFTLEINTAPGLEGTTIQDYADFFRSVV